MAVGWFVCKAVRDRLVPFSGVCFLAPPDSLPYVWEPQAFLAAIPAGRLLSVSLPVVLPCVPISPL